MEVPAKALTKLVCEEEFGGGRCGTWIFGEQVKGKEEVEGEVARRCWERTVGVLGEEEVEVGVGGGLS